MAEDWTVSGRVEQGKQGKDLGIQGVQKTRQWLDVVGKNQGRGARQGPPWSLVSSPGKPAPGKDPEAIPPPGAPRGQQNPTWAPGKWVMVPRPPCFQLPPPTCQAGRLTQLGAALGSGQQLCVSSTVHLPSFIAQLLHLSRNCPAFGSPSSQQWHSWGSPGPAPFAQEQARPLIAWCWAPEGLRAQPHALCGRLLPPFS